MAVQLAELPRQPSPRTFARQHEDSLAAPSPLGVAHGRKMSRQTFPREQASSIICGINFYATYEALSILLCLSFSLKENNTRDHHWVVVAVVQGKTSQLDSL